MPPLDRPHRAARLALFFIALGLLGRLARYALNFPLWGDEASLALNLAERDYAGLTAELDHFQVAPILFLWVEEATLNALGGSELALRLPPLVAGIAALLLFWRLAHAVLPPTAAALAVGLLAVARWPVTMSANLKPYSLDLLVSLALLAAAAAWLRQPRRRWLALLAALGPLAVGLSYPAAFVAGGASLTLLPALWRRRVVSEWCVFAIFNVLLLAAFLACLLLIGQPRPGAPDLRGFMADYWRQGFPPADGWRLPLWLASAHTGQMFAYPVGAERGGSLLTFALFAAGAAWAWRERPRWLLALCLAPFALHLLAAALHRYPYGVSARLAQHLAPAICLLAGAGLARLIEARPRALPAAVALLALCALAGMAADFARPYRDEMARWSRDLASRVKRLNQHGQRLVVLQPPEQVVPTIRWHLARLGDGVSWAGEGPGALYLDVRPDDGRPLAPDAVVLTDAGHRFRCTLYSSPDTSSRVSQLRSDAAR